MSAHLLRTTSWASFCHNSGSVIEAPSFRKITLYPEVVQSKAALSNHSHNGQLISTLTANQYSLSVQWWLSSVGLRSSSVASVSFSHTGSYAAEEEMKKSSNSDSELQRMWSAMLMPFKHPEFLPTLLTVWSHYSIKTKCLCDILQAGINLGYLFVGWITNYVWSKLHWRGEILYWI